ncbi:MAG: hypothetical protein ACRD3W_19075, partial [Terriglobales bacterium]
MIERKYFTLLQEQLDTTLPLAQQCALQGYLDGNQQAARLSESLLALAKGCDELTLPDQFVPADPQSLHVSIMSALSTRRGSGLPVMKWVLLLFNSSKKEQEHKSAQWRMHKMKREAQREIQGETLLQRAAPKKAPAVEQNETNLADMIRKRLLDMKSAEQAEDAAESLHSTSLVSNTGPVRAEVKAAASPVASLT